MRLSTKTSFPNVRSFVHAGAVLALLAMTALTIGCQREQVEDEEPVEAGTIEPTEEGEEEIGVLDEIQLEVAFLEPGEKVGMDVAGEAVVTEVVSDRGFWLGHKGNRIFTVVREDVPRREMIDINAGQRLDLRGTLLDQDSVDEVVEGSLDAQTRSIIEDQEYFLNVHHDDVEIVSQPQPEVASQKMLEVGGQAYGSFADHDADDNNLVTPREMTRGLEDMEYFGEWDNDDDSQLDEREFTRHIYTLADTNQNDRIEEQEFRMFTDMFEQVEGELAQWDDNDNNWLDNEEFANEVGDTDLFSDWDADDNDYVEYDEYGDGLFGLWDEDENEFLEVDEFGFGNGMEVTLR